jgi:hypothetical protein
MAPMGSQVMALTHNIPRMVIFKKKVVKVLFPCFGQVMSGVEW